MRSPGAASPSAIARRISAATCSCSGIRSVRSTGPRIRPVVTRSALFSPITLSKAKLKDAGYGPRTRFRDRRRSVARRSRSIAAWLRRRSDDAKDEVLAITAELVTITRSSLKEAQVMAQNTRRSLRRAGDVAEGRAGALVTELERTIAVVETVIAQTRLRLSGEMPAGSTRVVSLHDTDARPIRKGRLGRPVEFGYKA
jgi:IS5 family transposase